MRMKSVAIILAAGRGSRMNSHTPKQYMNLLGKPLIYYSLQTFEKSSVDEIILVVGENEKAYVSRDIVEKYNFTKVRQIISGGSERYFSVYNGLKAINTADYVLIHDGARPFITLDLIENVLEQVVDYKACAVGMPAKDTIKIVDDNNIVRSTPNRKYTWLVQTPQAFSYSLIMEAYDKIVKEKDDIDKTHGNLNITDDAMVVEYATGHPIKLIKATYSNIKITTPGDLEVGTAILNKIL